MKLRKLYKNNHAISHQLVNITSMSIFICVVLVAIINSVPLSPDTTVYSDTMDKKSMALQTVSMLTDSPGEASDGSPCWESVTDGSDKPLKPLSIGFKMNSYDPKSTDLRLLSLDKIDAFKKFDDADDYEMLKTDIFRLPSYFEYQITLKSLEEPPVIDEEYGSILDDARSAAYQKVNVLVYDPDPAPGSYHYAVLEVKIS